MKPRYSKRAVERFGSALVSDSATPEEIEEATAVLEMWRDAHKDPLDQMMALAQSCSKDLAGSLCVSRLKRRDTIIAKLARKNTLYTLRNLDDIAGCRVIVRTKYDVDLVVSRLKAADSYKSVKDRIAEPKTDGYRGIHVFHRFDSPAFGYEDMHVETQVRTLCQHAWATAVETYDLLSRSGLKFGNGTEDQARFFAIASELIASYEGCAHVPEMEATREELVSEFFALNNKLKAIPLIEGFCNSVELCDEKYGEHGVGYYLLEFSHDDNMVLITVFPEEDGERASRNYSSKERSKKEDSDVLLVKATGVEDLKAAYPNYFSDVSFFLNLIKGLLM